jgi:hypothetical protein
MELEIIEIKGTRISVLKSGETTILETGDSLDLMADSTSLGSSRIIVHKNQIIEDFFDLKSGIAGEILQKFSTYQVQLAIIGDFSKYTSKSLKDFIFESNKYGRISFVGTMEEAIEALTR